MSAVYHCVRKSVLSKILTLDTLLLPRRAPQLAEEPLGMSALTSVAVLPAAAAGGRALAFAGSADCQVRPDVGFLWHPSRRLRANPACCCREHLCPMRGYACALSNEQGTAGSRIDTRLFLRQVYACDGSTGAPLGTWLAHSDAVSAVAALGAAATPQGGARLLTASWDGTIKLWE